jgi:outer membrane immunogenic protein
MQRMLSLTAGSLMALIAVPALAGGPVTPAPEPVPVVVAPAPVATGGDWSGFYGGVQLGYGDVGSDGAGLDGNGAIGGVHAGYRYDFGTAVIGGELDYDIANMDLGATAGDELENVARLKLQAGYDAGRTLIYGTAGGARASASVGGADLSDNGWFAGIGADFAVTDRITVGGEVLRHQFDDFDGSGVDLDATTATARVSLRF